MIGLMAEGPILGQRYLGLTCTGVRFPVNPTKDLSVRSAAVEASIFSG